MTSRERTPHTNEKDPAMPSESKQHIHHINVNMQVIMFASENVCRQIRGVIRQQENTTRNDETVSRQDVDLIVANRLNGTTLGGRKSSCRIETIDKTHAGTSEMKLKSRDIHTRSGCSLVGYSPFCLRRLPKIPHLQKTIDAVEWLDDFVAVKNARGTPFCAATVLRLYGRKETRCGAPTEDVKVELQLTMSITFAVGRTLRTTRSVMRQSCSNDTCVKSRMSSISNGVIYASSSGNSGSKKYVVLTRL